MKVIENLLLINTGDEDEDSLLKGSVCSKANRGRYGMWTPRPSSVYTTNSLPLTSTPLCLCFTGDICEIHICTVTRTGQKSDSIFI